MKDLVRDLGNFGNLQKLERIIEGINTAKKHQCALVIAVDPLVYGQNIKTYSYSELNIAEVDFNKTQLFIGKDSYPWWDIVRVNVLF